MQVILLIHPWFLEGTNQVIHVKCLALYPTCCEHSTHVSCSHDLHHHHYHHQDSLSMPHCYMPIHTSDWFSNSPLLFHAWFTHIDNPKQSLGCLSDLFPIIEICHGVWYSGIRFSRPPTDLRAQAHGWEVKEAPHLLEVSWDTQEAWSSPLGVHSLPWALLYSRTLLKTSVHTSTYFTRL